jgi:hypothetical protein
MPGGTIVDIVIGVKGCCMRRVEGVWFYR